MKNILVAFILSGSVVLAQERPVAEFEKSNHDFGTIKEEDGPVTYEFIFTNTGKEPLIISRVKPSCGCTTPSWTKEPVLPGEKGTITAQYNPRNRPGAFRKSLTVTTNAEESVVRLYINGKVIPKPKTIEEEFRVKLGSIRLKTKSINMGRMTTQKPVSKVVEFYNDSDSVIALSQEVVAPEFINITFDSLQIAPKSKGNMTINYNPVHKNNLGFNSHSVYFQTDEGVDSKKDLHIMASIVEYFPPMSEKELDKAPKLNIQDRVFDFGSMQKGNIYETEFVLTNNGKSSLNIRTVKSNCACVVANADKYDLKPGKSAKLKVKFNSEGRRGNQIQNVTIYSNDPLDPTQLVTIKGKVAI